MPPTQVGVGKSGEVRAALIGLILMLASCPTHDSELVEYDPKLAGTCDASAGRGFRIGYKDVHLMV